MGRARTIPDHTIFAAVRSLLAEGGEKAVTFSSVARVTGLAAPTLVQRYGARGAMLQAALIQAWDALDAATTQAEAEAPLTAKGAAQMLRLLSDSDAGTADLALLAAAFRDAALRARAVAWRSRVEGALTIRLGGGARGRDAAAILFAGWQGQTLWRLSGERTFRIKDAIKRLA